MRARCPHCGAMARTMRNAFYGTGFAVHDTIIDCRECHNIRLVHRRDLITEPVRGRMTKLRFRGGKLPRRANGASR